MYSLALNRRYSAYILSGTAMRSAIVMGLHLNIPDAQLPDFGAREHRKRLFWTAYMFDRMWGASLGHPSAIQDDEIEVDLPSTLPFSGAAGGDQLSSDDFDCQYHVASIELVRHLANVVRSIYSLRRQNQDAQLSMRVHQSLQDLHAWMYRLPPRLQIDHSPGAANHWKVVSLHLSFYQVSISISPHCHCPCLAPGFTYKPRSASSLPPVQYYCMRCEFRLLHRRKVQQPCGLRYPRQHLRCRKRACDVPDTLLSSWLNPGLMDLSLRLIAFSPNICSLRWLSWQYRVYWMDKTTKRTATLLKKHRDS